MWSATAFFAGKLSQIVAYLEIVLPGDHVCSATALPRACTSSASRKRVQEALQSRRSVQRDLAIIEAQQKGFDADPDTSCLPSLSSCPASCRAPRLHRFFLGSGRHLTACRATRSLIGGILIPISTVIRSEITVRFQMLTYCAWGCFRYFCAPTLLTPPPSPPRVPHSSPKTDTRPKTSPPASDSHARRRHRTRRLHRPRRVPG
jgi:hypothetical protein